MSDKKPKFQMFQHTAARRRLDPLDSNSRILFCFNTQPPEGGWLAEVVRLERQAVSTHSRPKAAGWGY